MQLIKFGWLLPLGRGELAWIWAGLGFGILCKLLGYDAIRRGVSVDAFIRWHTLWHASLPLTFGAFHSRRWLVCEGCSRA